jgi:tRNA uridine 5-carboxymethylaminomethyl modification enzyme
MSCNPAVGGLGKGQLVREVDALGGEMGKAADATGIQFRRLNASKGPSVRSTRAQADKALYARRMKNAVERQANLHLRQGLVESLVTSGGAVRGVRTLAGGTFYAECVVICPGTFLDGLIHVGLTSFPGGRMGEEASTGLAASMRGLGFTLGRFKTGTTPRLDGKTIDFSKTTPQHGDMRPPLFSFSSREPMLRQVPCWITHTTEESHEILRENLTRSPMYSGVITGTGVRYCPSVEDKIVKFSDRTSHHVFLEPEGLDTCEFYPNGISTSMPVDVQERLVRSIPGLERCEIIRPGYAIEHDYSDPTTLKLSLESRIVEGLFLAGQVNGTTGYEEAAAQGLIAGINAALKVKGAQPLVLDRSQAYIGVLIDDLVTKGTQEPYRMMTSRAEYRLVLREDNADLRLCATGFSLGLIGADAWERVESKRRAVAEELQRLRAMHVTPTAEVNGFLDERESSPLKKPVTLENLLQRPELSYDDISALSPAPSRLDPEALLQVEIEAKYRGFLERQRLDIERFRSMENERIPADFNYDKISGLSREVKEKLGRHRPASMGQASRISGVTPAALSILSVFLHRWNHDMEWREKLRRIE